MIDTTFAAPDLHEEFPSRYPTFPATRSVLVEKINIDQDTKTPRSITLTLPYPISANRYWNSFPLGKRIMTAPSAEAKKYKRDVALIAKAAGVRDPIQGRVQIDIQLYPKRPLDWQARQRKVGVDWDDTVQCLDLDNARKVVYDSLNGVVIEDDKWVRRDTGERMEPDADGPRLVVTVTELMTKNPQGALI